MRFGHGELHLVLLALLNERPMHGYELMAELSARSDQMYRSSPGSIYPAVQSLEAEGLISSRLDDDRRIYELTAVGRQALAERGDRLARIEARLGIRVNDAKGAALARFAERVRAVVPHLDEKAMERVLERTASQLERMAKGGTK